MDALEEELSRVGPVLASGASGAAVAAAIRRSNERVVVRDQGGYLRVSAPERCRVTRAAIEEELGRPFRLPQDLERIMPSFKGRLTLTEEEAQWEARPKRGPA